MEKIYKIAKENLKNKYDIDITEKELDNIYTDFVRSCISLKHSNLLRDIYLPEFGSIKLSQGKLIRALRSAFKRRDKVKVPFYIDALRKQRKLSKEYWEEFNKNDKLKKELKLNIKNNDN